MSDVQERLGNVLERLATGTNVHRARKYDNRRAVRNGAKRDERLEAAVLKFESAADELWGALGLRLAPPASENLREAA